MKVSTTESDVTNFCKEAVRIRQGFITSNRTLIEVSLMVTYIASRCSKSLRFPADLFHYKPFKIQYILFAVRSFLVCFTASVVDAGPPASVQGSGFVGALQSEFNSAYHQDSSPISQTFSTQPIRSPQENRYSSLGAPYPSVQAIFNPWKHSSNSEGYLRTNYEADPANIHSRSTDFYANTSYETSPEYGEIIRTPPVSYPQELSESPIVYDSEESFSRPLEKSKPGVLQKISFTGTWVDRNGLNGLGMNELELYTTFGFPMPTRESPLLVTPGFEVNFLDGPVAVDLPARVYDAYLQLRWMRKLNDRWGIDLAVSPGVHSDFEYYEDDSLRITGHGIASYHWRPGAQVILGVAYLDRDDVSLLPAAGVIWTPNDDWRYDLLVPRPKIARRFWCAPGAEDWLYIAGEFGGGSWTIERTSGLQDQVVIREYRAMLGIERKVDGGGGRRIEVGWVFGRNIEYSSATPDFEPDGSAMVRGSLVY